jgi:hypothetical protein
MAAAAINGCGGSAMQSTDASDAGSGDGGGLMCSYADGGTPDGGAFHGTCPSGGCAAGTVCVVEVGGVGGGGGEYCAPIPIECHGTPTCACMGRCVCTNTFGGQPETCNTQNGTIFCDNGIR